MRELKRSIAKARMQEAGYRRLFKRTKSEKVKGRSVFARNWRKFLGKKPGAKPLDSFGLSKKRKEYWPGQKQTRFHKNLQWEASRTA